MAATPSDGSDPAAADDRELVATRTFEAPRALVWTVFTGVLDHVEGDGSRVITTVILEDADGGTRVTVRQTVPGAEGPAAGQRQGWTETLEKLAEHLEARAAGRPETPTP